MDILGTIQFVFFTFAGFSNSASSSLSRDE